MKWSKRNLTGNWQSFWETKVHSESEWTRESIRLHKGWFGKYELIVEDNTHDYIWGGFGRLVTDEIFMATIVSTRSGANSVGAGMFVSNTEGTHLIGHWYGFTSESVLVAAKWLLVREWRDPKSIIERWYGQDSLDAFCRSSETGFVGPVRRKVFISYRREDAVQTANLLQKDLGQIFGDENVFTDLQRIAPGMDFLQEIEREIGACDTVLVLIGTGWLIAKNEKGPRLFDDSDLVRLEIMAAMNRAVPVIPVLIDDAPMPRPDELPNELRELCRRQTVRFRHTEFRESIQRIVRMVRQPRVPRRREPT